MHRPPRRTATVYDAAGRKLSPCPVERAWALVAAGNADLISQEPLEIRLRREVLLPEPEPQPERPAEGRRLLLHVCCGPCATYPVQQLRAEGFAVTAFWYNPNVHPYTEHERRREALQKLAEAIQLPVLEEEGYDLVAFLRAVCGRESLGERCAICYWLRLERTARAAHEGGFDAFSTTLLVSIHQDEAAIRAAAEEAARAYGVPFHYERFRRGWSERGRLTKAYGLYRQDYCGCVYSEWERHRPRT
ncbi:MAG: epoxyqueuosine reductase QueH [Chloroflexia bacterium]